MNDLLTILAGEPFDAEDISATSGWLECGCGTEWWIAEAPSEDTPASGSPCLICAAAPLRRAMHEHALAGVPAS